MNPARSPATSPGWARWPRVAGSAPDGTPATSGGGVDDRPLSGRVTDIMGPSAPGGGPRQERGEASVPGTAAAAVLDLFVEEPVLGSDSRFFREAGVAFGHPTVGPIGDDELPEPVTRRPDLRKRRFTALHLPFDLEELKSGQRYIKAMVRLTFDCNVRAVTVSCTTS